MLSQVVEQVGALAGRQGGQVILLGSHFKLRGFAKHYRALLPAGVSGSFHGRFVQCDRAAEASKCHGPRPDADRAEPKRGDANPGEARERGQQSPEQPDDKDEVPTLAELAAMLAGQ